MSITALLLAIIAALLLSNTADAFPEILWAWIYLPGWLPWLLLLALFAWCVDD